MNAELETTYRKIRNQGWTASNALSYARTQLEWLKLEGVIVHEGDSYDDSFESLVRLRIVNDDDLSTAMNFDCDVKGCKQDCRIHQKEASRIESLGVVGIQGQYRNTLDSEWIIADSCYGFVGQDWEMSGYDVDIMQATLDAFQHFVGC